MHALPEATSRPRMKGMLGGRCCDLIQCFGASLWGRKLISFGILLRPLARPPARPPNPPALSTQCGSTGWSLWNFPAGDEQTVTVAGFLTYADPLNAVAQPVKFGTNDRKIVWCKMRFIPWHAVEQSNLGNLAGARRGNLWVERRPAYRDKLE
jgi:hypothetical protein